VERARGDGHRRPRRELLRLDGRAGRAPAAAARWRHPGGGLAVVPPAHLRRSSQLGAPPPSNPRSTPPCHTSTSTCSRCAPARRPPPSSPSCQQRAGP
jgi:hypothetical protein